MPGTDFHQFNPPNFKDLQRVQPKDEFSSLPVYEQTLSRMKKSIVDDPEGYPAKILLTGNKYFYVANIRKVELANTEILLFVVVIIVVAIVVVIFV